MKRLLVFLVLALQLLFAACADAAATIPPPPGSNNIYIQDLASVVSPADRAKIYSIGKDLENQTTAQISILTINTLDGQPIEDYALQVLRSWGVGQKDKNNGVLIVVATADRRSRIEVGYGLEGVLTDGYTGFIQDKYMLPYFKKGDYSAGILQGYAATAGAIAKSEGKTLTGVKAPKYTRTQQSTESSLSPMQKLVFGIGLIAFLLIDNIFLGGFFTRIILFSIFRGGGGGRGGGFGGGSGGGGGSSRSW